MEADRGGAKLEDNREALAERHGFIELHTLLSVPELIQMTIKFVEIYVHAYVPSFRAMVGQGTSMTLIPRGDMLPSSLVLRHADFHLVVESASCVVGKIGLFCPLSDKRLHEFFTCLPAGEQVIGRVPGVQMPAYIIADTFLRPITFRFQGQ